MTRALHAQLTSRRLLAALIVAGALAMRRSRPRHRAAPRPASCAGCALPSVHDREPELPRRRFPAGQRGVRAAGLQGLRMQRQEPRADAYLVQRAGRDQSFVLAFSPPRATTYTGTCVGITGRVGRPLLGTCSRLQPPAPARRPARMTNLRATAGLAPSSRSRTDRRRVRSRRQSARDSRLAGIFGGPRVLLDWPGCRRFTLVSTPCEGAVGAERGTRWMSSLRGGVPRACSPGCCWPGPGTRSWSSSGTASSLPRTWNRPPRRRSALRRRRSSSRISSWPGAVSFSSSTCPTCMRGCWPPG
jgi:hypothetical protein